MLQFSTYTEKFSLNILPYLNFLIFMLFYPFYFLDIFHLFQKFTFAINGKETKNVIGNRTREYSKSVQISLFWLRDPLAFELVEDTNNTRCTKYTK